MILDYHYWIYVYFIPFLIFFGIIFILLSRIFPKQKKAVAVIAAAMSILGIGYAVNTGFARSFFLGFVGKSVELLGVGGIVAAALIFLGIKIVSAIPNRDKSLGRAMLKMFILIIFSLMVLWIFKDTVFEEIGSSIIRLLFIVGLLGFFYILSKMIMKERENE